jgi:hypothetical protein
VEVASTGQGLGKAHGQRTEIMVAQIANTHPSMIPASELRKLQIRSISAHPDG